jgi:hypothetical protein
MHLYWNNDRGRNFVVPIIHAQLYPFYLKCNYILTSHSIPLHYFKNSEWETGKDMQYWKLWFKFKTFAFCKSFFTVGQTRINEYNGLASIYWLDNRMRIQIIFAPSISFFVNHHDICLPDRKRYFQSGNWPFNINI